MARCFWKCSFWTEAQTEFNKQGQVRCREILSRTRRLEPVRTCKHSRTFRWNEAARLSRTRAGAESARASHGRTVRRAVRPHSRAALRRYSRDLENPSQNHRL